MPALVAAQPSTPQQSQQHQQPQAAHDQAEGSAAAAARLEAAAAEAAAAAAAAEEARLRKEQDDREWEAMTASTWDAEALAAWEAAASAGAEAASAHGAGAAALSGFYSGQTEDAVLSECARRGISVPPGASREQLTGALLRTFFCSAACVVCLDDWVQIGFGLECSPGRHFVCSRCLAKFIEAEAAMELSVR